MGRNDVTGDRIRSKNQDAEARARFEANFETVFGKKKPPVEISAEYKGELAKAENQDKSWLQGDFT